MLLLNRDSVGDSVLTGLTAHHRVLAETEMGKKYMCRMGGTAYLHCFAWHNALKCIVNLATFRHYFYNAQVPATEGSQIRSAGFDLPDMSFHFSDSGRILDLLTRQMLVVAACYRNRLPTTRQTHIRFCFVLSISHQLVKIHLPNSKVGQQLVHWAVVSTICPNPAPSNLPNTLHDRCQHPIALLSQV